VTGPCPLGRGLSNYKSSFNASEIEYNFYRLFWSDRAEHAWRHSRCVGGSNRDRTRRFASSGIPYRRDRLSSFREIWLHSLRNMRRCLIGTVRPSRWQ